MDMIWSGSEVSWTQLTNFLCIMFTAGLFQVYCGNILNFEHSKSYCVPLLVVILSGNTSLNVWPVVSLHSESYITSYHFFSTSVHFGSPILQLQNVIADNTGRRRTASLSFIMRGR